MDDELKGKIGKWDRIKLDENIRIDTFTNSSPKVIMRLIHIPTSTSVQGEGVSQFLLRKELLEKLQKLVSTL